jgi:histone H3/H4
MSSAVDIPDRDYIIKEDSQLGENSRVGGNEANIPNIPTTGIAPGLQIPLARVRKIIKEDEDVQLCSSDAATLISLATEMFSDYLAKKSFEYAVKDKRKTLLLKDIARAVKENDDLFFLTDATTELVMTTESIKKEKHSLPTTIDTIGPAEHDEEATEPPTSQIAQDNVDTL